MREKLKLFTMQLLKVLKIDSPLTTPLIIGKIDRLTDDEILEVNAVLQNYVKFS